MAYHIEHKGVALSSKQSDTAAYVIQGSVSIETAVAERPTAALSVRVPPGVTLAPRTSTKSPSTIRRCRTEPGLSVTRTSWPTGGWTKRRWRSPWIPRAHTPLTYGGGNGLQYRAYRQETSAVPYGGAPEWEHTSGNGLSGTLPTGIDPEWTIAGFIRLKAGSTGDRDVWTAGAANRRFRVNANGSIACRFGAGTMTAPAGTITADTWHHVALKRTATARELWVDRGDGRFTDGRRIDRERPRVDDGGGRRRRCRESRAGRVGYLV